MNIAQKDQAVPWSLRERITPLRTYSGRVVYDRDRHFFTARDVERIASKAKKSDKPPKDLSSWERLLRAIWKLYFPMVLPYPADWDEPLFFLLGGIFVDIWQNVADPLGAIKRRYLEFIYSIAGVLGIEQQVADRFKSFQTKPPSEESEE